MIDPPPFYSARQRLDRARTHREAFIAMWHKILDDEEPYSPGLHIEADGSGSIWIYRRSLPKEMPLVFGEMLYQLRAALDACVYEAVALETRKNPPPDEDDLEFPIRSSPDRFEKARWHMGELSDPRQRLIEAVQPYNAPHVSPAVRFVNESLGILNDWARKDRHRSLHIVGAWASEANPMICLPEGVGLASMDVNTDGFFFDEHHEIASFVLTGYSPGMQVYASPNVMLDIAINEPPLPRDTSELFPVRVDRMVAAVSGVVEIFERSFWSDAPQDFRRP